MSDSHRHLKTRSESLQTWALPSALFVLLASVLLSGCQTQVQKQTTLPPQVRVSQDSAQPNASSVETSSKEDPIGSDPCASRLHNISGQFLMYYALNGRLPAQMSDLKTVADVDDQTDYVCPISHQPYSYVPGGLTLPSGGPRLIAFDAAPVHNGFRWGILFSTPKGKQPATTWVIKLNSALFAEYEQGQYKSPGPTSHPAASPPGHP